MKKRVLPLAVLLAFITLSSGLCSKDGPEPGLLEHYPQTWILAIDEGPDKYTVLRTNGAFMFRKSVDKSYSLTQLAIDEDCEWEASLSKREDGTRNCVSLRLDKNKKLWMGVTNSPNRQEIFLNTLNTTSTDPGDTYKFFVHNMPDVNGVKTVVLESVWKTGYYISSSPPGFQYAANQVTLLQASSPEKATHWQCR